MTERKLPRREVLRLGLGALASLPLLAACDTESDSAGSGADAHPPPEEAQDGGPGELDAAGEVPLEDAGVAPDAEGPEQDAEGPDEETEAIHAQLRGPWTQWGAQGALHIRLEIFAQARAPTLWVDGEPVALQVSEVDLDWAWPPGGRVPDRDVPGRYALYEATVAGPQAGESLSWRVEGAFGEREGVVRAPQADGSGRIAWISDTMWPNSEDVAPLIAAEHPDFVIHGGDIQYRSNPGDTYNGFFRIWRPLFTQAPMQFCVGNHEKETSSELGQFFRRIFAEQGQRASAESLATVVAFGCARFLLCDSEVEGFEEGNAQLRWIEETLSALRADESVRQVALCMHRPFWSFSKGGGNHSGRRLVEPLLRAHQVRLVLTGHNHCYERFEVEGLTAIVDGGAGAILNDPDAGLGKIEAEYPEELPLRQISEASHGGMILELAADGTLEVRRLNRNGTLTDTFTVPSWRA